MRAEILSRYCSVTEIGNYFWEYEDNCTLNNGIDIDILYRDLDSFAQDVASVVEQFQARNGYTTCMWHNLKNCKTVYDREGRLEALKRRFDVAYPDALRRNIIERNRKLLYAAMPAYKGQISKAVKRKDIVSIGHRTAAFMESYFDILFALNSQTHPGEKRLLQLCRQNCSILPEHFEDNINRLSYSFIPPVAALKGSCLPRQSRHIVCRRAGRRTPVAPNNTKTRYSGPAPRDPKGR